MSAARKLMTPEEFLTWCLTQEGRWELVAGEPVLMMAGAALRHDRVVVNLITALDRRLAGSPCEPHTDDIASRMQSGNIRRPDVTIACGPFDPDALESAEPAVFFEVLSPSTQSFDFLRKPDEYRQVASLKHFVIVDPQRPRVRLFSRGPEGWTDQDIVGLDSVLPLPGVGVELPFEEIYRRITFADPA
jgi:Uma2 family endonuclease